MKFNWVNLLATLLIVGGICLLIEKRLVGHQARHVPTVDEAKADIQRQVSGKLGRPLTEAETDMIEVTKNDEQINITLHQPLYGRLLEAVQAAKAATQPGALPTPGASTPTSTGGVGQTDPDKAPASNSP
jgi:hypothetical protein